MFKEPGVASCRQVRDKLMGRVLEQTLYQCDRCGATSVVAASVVYQQGTRTYSTRFGCGITQSFSAQAWRPPQPRGYIRPLLAWGPATIIFIVWTLVGVSALYEHPIKSLLRPSAVAMFLLLASASLLGMALNLRKIVRYNRDVYPRLHWNWEHTYICQRCGKSQLI